MAEARSSRRQRRLDQIEIPEDHVVITDELLGKGGFGEVYLADYNGHNAAVKVCGSHSRPRTSTAVGAVSTGRVRVVEEPTAHPSAGTMLLFPAVTFCIYIYISCFSSLVLVAYGIGRRHRCSTSPTASAGRVRTAY